MSREEELVRRTTHAIASTVDEVPPLWLEPAAVEPGVAARAPRRRFSGRGRQRRWRSWGAPLTAAALVVALAISLVLVRDMPNGGGVSPSPATVAGTGGAPRYYVALKEIPGRSHSASWDFEDGIVVGDASAGKTLATFAPPAGTTFQSVSAAADDRTFAVFAVSSSTGNLGVSRKDVTLTGTWYRLQLAPGTAHPARLTRLPVKPQSWAYLPSWAPAPGQVYATALSPSGQELAVADIPEVPAAGKPRNWQEVKVFSVATGRLLHEWTGNDPGSRLDTVLTGTLDDVPDGTPDLTWIDGDRALALATSRNLAGGVMTGTLRRLDMAGPVSGNLMTDSTVIWSGALPASQAGGCRNETNWPPLVSGDGTTVSCVTVVQQYATPGQADISTYPLPAGIAAGLKPRLDYRLPLPPERQSGGVEADILWVSPSAGTLVVKWVPGGDLKPPHQAYFWAVSRGKFFPLRIPVSMAKSTVADIAF